MQQLDLAQIQKLCKKSSVQWTGHVFKRMMERGISTDDIEHVILNGEIIENYPTSYPYPSCLILGLTVNNRNIHVVCGVGENKLWIVTAYEPDEEKWESDFRTRKGAI
mgnify:CR=1 FL=1